MSHVHEWVIAENAAIRHVWLSIAKAMKEPKWEAAQRQCHSSNKLHVFVCACGAVVKVGHRARRESPAYSQLIRPTKADRKAWAARPLKLVKYTRQGCDITYVTEVPRVAR